MKKEYTLTATEYAVRKNTYTVKAKSQKKALKKAKKGGFLTDTADISRDVVFS